MVGVVGSSPIAPTKQNPLCWAVWKGSPKGGPFLLPEIWAQFRHAPFAADGEAGDQKKS